MQLGASGQPAHEPTEEKKLIVKELYEAGIPRERIAKRIGISADTLNKHYEEQLDKSKDEAISKLNKSLYCRAIDGDQKASEFWLRCQARWSYAKADEDIEKDKQTQTLMEKLIDKL